MHGFSPFSRRPGPKPSPDALQAGGLLLVTSICHPASRPISGPDRPFQANSALRANDRPVGQARHVQHYEFGVG